MTEQMGFGDKMIVVDIFPVSFAALVPSTHNIA